MSVRLIASLAPSDDSNCVAALCASVGLTGFATVLNDSSIDNAKVINAFLDFICFCFFYGIQAYAHIVLLLYDDYLFCIAFCGCHSHVIVVV